MVVILVSGLDLSNYRSERADGSIEQKYDAHKIILTTLDCAIAKLIKNRLKISYFQVISRNLTMCLIPTTLKN